MSAKLNTISSRIPFVGARGGYVCLNTSPIVWIYSSSVTVDFRVHIHSLSLQMVNIQLNIHYVDISWFTGEESDLGGDDCEKAESWSSAQIMPDTSDSGDFDWMDCLASWELSWVEAVRRKKDYRPLPCFSHCMDRIRITNSKLKRFNPWLSLSSVLFTASLPLRWSKSDVCRTRPWVTWVLKESRWQVTGNKATMAYAASFKFLQYVVVVDTT